MNKKVEKASPSAAVSVATASVVATNTLASSATTTSSVTNATKTVSVTKDIPSSNPKLHPKTLDIPGTAPKKSAVITSPPVVITNGANSSSNAGIPPIKAEKRMAPTAGAIAGNNKKVMESPRHVVNTGEDISSSKEKQKEKQNNISPTSSLSSSSPSSTSASGIHPAQFASICREVANVREEHLSIRKCLSEREGELGKTRVALRNIAQERDILRKKVSELEHILKHSPEMSSHVAAILSNSKNPLLSGSSPKSDFQMSPCSSASSPSSSKHSPEEGISPTARVTNNSHGHYAPLPSNMSGHATTAIVSSPARNIIVQDQNLKLTSPSHSRPNFVPGLRVAGGNPTVGTMGSPRKCNGNEGNLNRKGCLADTGGNEVGELQKVGRAAGGGAFPYSPRSSSPNITNNINSQESHQAGHNNKNLHQQQQRQHSTPQHQSNYSQMNNVKLTTTTTTATFTAIPADKNKSIYCGHEQQGARDTPPPLSQQYLEYHNRNSRNVNGNDIPGMTNSNNNNNHFKSTSAGGGGKGGGHGHHHQQQQHDYHHQNQHHLSQSGITGLDLMLLGPDCSTKVVEHLVHPVAIESSVREIQHTLVLKGVPLNGDRLREVEIEIDRLNSRIDHLRSQNDVLTLNLEDAKSHADRLTVLLGKYESNNVALQLALRYSDQMSDAYEVLAALLETELGQVVTSLHAAGQIHLICAPPAPSSNSTTTSGVFVASRSAVTSSGNNNNSNDNSPSDHVPPLSSAKNGNNKNCVACNGENSVEKKNYDNSGKNVAVDEARNKQSDKNHNSSNGGREDDHHSPDNEKTATSNVTSPVDSSGKAMMVSVKNRSDPNKIMSPVSPSSSTPSSTKAMNLLEQARRNRLAAEQAARFLLSRFPSASMHTVSQGVVISPTGSDNNNGRSGGGSSFLLRPTCQSNSTTSINSVTSNMSGESDGGQESLSLSSPSVADEKEAEKQQQRQKNKEGEQMSTTITGGVTTETEVAINVENTKMSKAAEVGGNSPVSTSTTLRAPFSPNGNGPLNGSTSIITSLLPLLRNAVANTQHQNNGPPPEAIESTIRHLISTLKAERDAVKQTVMELESESLESLTPSPKPSSPYYGNGHNNNNNNSSSSNATPTAPWSPAEARKLDLETAVLMQELMAMKEERAELRAQLFLVEKEKSSLELRLRSHESQEEAYRARINYLKSEIMDCKSLHSTTAVTTMDTYQHDRNRNDIMKSQQQQQQQKNNGNNRNLETIINNNNNNQNVNWEREALLKKRMHELAATLEKVTYSSQIREKQNQEMINELNRANGILMQTLDVAKKKYQNRIQKMEDQIMYISARHSAQLKLFGEKTPTVVGKYHG